MSLPTRIKQNIRDHVTSPTSPLAQRTAKVTEVLGYPVELDPEWAMLWSTLEPYFPDNSTFIPSVSSVVIAWCDAFTTWIEDESNEEDVDKVLDGLKSKWRLQLMLVSAKGTRPTTTFDPDKKCFNIVLPQSRPIPTTTTLASFADDFRTLFTAPAPTPLSSKTSALPDEPDWADVSVDSHPVSIPQRGGAISNSPQAVLVEETMPNVATVERPEEFLRRPPYWLLVRQEGRGRVVVESSHGPTLGFLDAYLKKWCRGETQRVDRPPMIQVNLRESPFGLGLLHDSLVLEALRGREVSALIILSLVESVLGYESVPNAGSAGSVWEFKRMRAFK